MREAFPFLLLVLSMSVANVCASDVNASLAYEPYQSLFTLEEIRTRNWLSDGERVSFQSTTNLRVNREDFILVQYGTSVGGQDEVRVLDVYRKTTDGDYQFALHDAMKGFLIRGVDVSETQAGGTTEIRVTRACKKTGREMRYSYTLDHATYKITPPTSIYIPAGGG
jgi:hypothetical protein